MIKFLSKLFVTDYTLPRELRAEVRTLAQAVRLAVAHIERDGNRVSVAHQMAKLAQLARSMAKQSLASSVEALVRFSDTWDRELVVRRMADTDAAYTTLGFGADASRSAKVRVERFGTSKLSVDVAEGIESDVRTFVFGTIVALGEQKMVALLHGDRPLRSVQLSFAYATALGIAPALLNDGALLHHPGEITWGRRSHRNICAISDESAAAIIAIWLTDGGRNVDELKPLLTRRMYRRVSAYLPQVCAVLAEPTPPRNARITFQTLKPDSET